MLRIADADAAAVMDRYPRRAARGREKGIEQRPIGNRVAAVHHRFGLAIGARDRARVEVVAADDDRRFQFTRRDHLVEREPREVPFAQA